MHSPNLPVQNPVRGGAIRLVRYEIGARVTRLLHRLRRRFTVGANASGDILTEPCVPFVHETPGHKSLHFSLSETQSVMLKSAPCALVEDYTRAMMGFLAFHPRPRRIAMIGLGGGSLAKFCYRELPDAGIDVVEINPHVVALRDEFRVPPDDHRFRVIVTDGAAFLRHTDRRYDVLLVDAYTRDGVPENLSTPAFYEDCRRVLHSDGVMVMNLSGARSHGLFDRIRDAFPASFFLCENAGDNRIAFALSSVPATTSPPEGSAPRILPALAFPLMFLMPVVVRVHAGLHTSQ